MAAPAKRRGQVTALVGLPDSDQEALLDWLEQQLGQARRLRRQLEQANVYPLDTGEMPEEAVALQRVIRGLGEGREGPER